MYDETARFELHEGLREALGEARGDTLMSLLPPVGWADVATTEGVNRKIDALGARLDVRIDALGARLDARIDALGVRIDALAAVTAAQFEASRLDSERRMAQLEARLHRDMLRLTWSMIGGLVAVGGIVTANNLL